MDFDNIFDKAMADADSVIIKTMGIPVKFTIGGIERDEIPGVFDEPGNDVTLDKGSLTVRNTSPTLFVFYADVIGVARHDSVVVNGEVYRVTDPGWDELSGKPGSTVTICLGRGAPGNNTPEVTAPSKPQWMAQNGQG